MPISSAINLWLNNIPKIDDPVIYEAVLDIHNAIEAIVAGTGTTVGFADAAAYVARMHHVVITGVLNYYVSDTNGLILASGAANACNIILPVAADVYGYEFKIKCLDTTYPVTVKGDGVEPIDTHIDGIGLNLRDSIVVKSDGNEWWIL